MAFRAATTALMAPSAVETPVRIVLRAPDA